MLSRMKGSSWTFLITAQLNLVSYLMKRFSICFEPKTSTPGPHYKCLRGNFITNQRQRAQLVIKEDFFPSLGQAYKKW